MSQRELLIILAHALCCPTCRNRLIDAPQLALRGHALTEDEKERLGRLRNEDFLTPELLARSSGTAAADLQAYGDYGVVRLRHF